MTGADPGRDAGDRPAQRRRVSEHHVPGRIRRGIRGRAAENRPLLRCTSRTSSRVSARRSCSSAVFRRRQALVSCDPGERRARRERRAATEPCRRAQRDRVRSPSTTGGLHVPHETRRRQPSRASSSTRAKHGRRITASTRRSSSTPEAASSSATTSVCRSTWDPQLSSPRFDCICNPASFIGDYFGIDSARRFTYTASVETFNRENPGYHSSGWSRRSDALAPVFPWEIVHAFPACVSLLETALSSNHRQLADGDARDGDHLGCATTP